MKKLTLGALASEFKAQDPDDLGMAVNSHRKTCNDMVWLEDIPGGLTRDIETITSGDIEVWADRLSFGTNKIGNEMSDAGAVAVYSSIKRLLAYAVKRGYLSQNPFDGVRRTFIPYVERKKKEKGETAPAFTKEDGKKLVSALIKSEPTFAAVKSTLYTILAYRHKKTPGYLLKLTWNQLDADEGVKADPFLKQLISNYRSALEDYLLKNGIDNSKGYVFVMNKANAKASPMDSGFVGSWVRENILKPKALPNMTAFKLCAKDAPRDVFEEVDAGGDFPILGEITFPTFGSGGGGARYDHEKIAAERAARRAAYRTSLDRDATEGGENND